MTLTGLSNSDAATIGECLRAAADGPFFPDWEFQTLFGLSRTEVRLIADSWPDVDASQADVELAVNNAINNLLSYPHGKFALWSHWVASSPEQVGHTYARLRKQSGGVA